MMNFWVISIVLISYISHEIINIGFKRLLYVCLMIFIALFTLCNAYIITYSDRIEQFYVVVKIRPTFKGCKQNFEG